MRTKPARKPISIKDTRYLFSPNSAKPIPPKSAAYPPATPVVKHSKTICRPLISRFNRHDNSSKWGTLHSHFAETNPVWQATGTENRWLAVFQDSGRYISPNWYPSKQRDHKAVPT
ncbi:FMN-binding negative transcriptional regulator [Neisseria sp. 19428wB4_WF04]|nr:FMN-binding negative transcriptional regulator [Neisseria sp. 19428wB4_WF04]